MTSLLYFHLFPVSYYSQSIIYNNIMPMEIDVNNEDNDSV